MRRGVVLAAAAVGGVLVMSAIAAAFWQARSAQQDMRALEDDLAALEERIIEADDEDARAAEIAKQAERRATRALEEAATVERRLSKAVRRLSKAVRSLREDVSAISVAEPEEETPAIQECGNQPAGGSWTYGDVDGAGHFNLTAQGLSCTEARYIVDHINFGSSPPYEPNYPGWSCAYVKQEYEFTDIRCTSGSKVIRWQGAA